MTMLAEHFVKPPEWTWYILTYFFLAGLSGGSYALGALLRLWRRPGYQAAARLAFLAAFPLILACPLLLFAFWFLDERRPLAFAAFAFLAATTKEEVALVVAGFGIWYSVARKKRWLSRQASSSLSASRYIRKAKPSGACRRCETFRARVSWSSGTVIKGVSPAAKLFTFTP